MSTSESESTTPLWAITSYFNPVGYRSKLRNYRVFRERLDVPLVAVELSHREGFELAAGDADRLIQIRGGDVMWQKERLLNLALRHLPDECKHVAWLDCDIVFGRTDWAAAAMEELQRVPFCQLFKTVHHLGPDAGRAGMGPESALLSQDSMGYAHSVGLVYEVAPLSMGYPKVYKRGQAYCARRALLDDFGLYDRNVVGGADRLIAHAVTAEWEKIIDRDELSPAHAANYRQWALPFHDATQGKMGYVDGEIFHLWHGDFKQRQYHDRKTILNAFGYDPATDIALDTEGCWRWNSPKYEMHRKVREYFESRKEDGNSTQG